ncbi:MAG: head GIN domain-containing protein [Saprospiraceae bacterium]|nr:head GIN domain-containing protein [Saprospiraceae bacterium]
MKKLFALPILIALFAVSLTGCLKESITGSGTIVTENRTISSPFSEIRVEGSMNVLVKQGDTVKVVAKDYANILPYLDIRVISNVLVISYENNAQISNSAGEVTVTLPKLIGVELVGSGNISTINNFNFTDLSLNTSGSGNLSFAGTCKTLNALISGSGDIRAYGLPTETIRASISGSGNMQLNVSRALNATILGSGNIIYKGNPTTLTISVSGSGSVRKF